MGRAGKIPQSSSVNTFLWLRIENVLPSSNLDFAQFASTPRYIFSNTVQPNPAQPVSQELETMASGEINIIAIITPHPDKFSIVEELVKGVAAKVQENEPGVLAYQAHMEKKKDGSGTIVFVEK